MNESFTDRKVDKSGKPQCMLRGFSQNAATRIYTFEAIGDGERVEHTVEVCLELIRGYGIGIQDLPLLCRDFLRARLEAGERGALVFSEQEMRHHAEELARVRAEAIQRKKPTRYPTHTNPGTAWRNTFR